MKDSNSPNEVLMINGSTNITLEISDCWDELESKESTEVYFILKSTLNVIQVTKGIYYSNLQWKCSSWLPHLDTFITVNNSNNRSGITVFISTNGKCLYNLYDF
jgi:hypothetical protein